MGVVLTRSFFAMLSLDLLLAISQSRQSLDCLLLGMQSEGDVRQHANKFAAGFIASALGLGLAFARADSRQTAPEISLIPSTLSQLRRSFDRLAGMLSVFHLDA